METGIYINEYGRYCIPKAHRRIDARKVKNGEIFEPETLEFVEKNIDNRCMISAGAYFGDMLPAFSSFTKGLVFAFEPIPDHFVCACKTIKLNGLGNVLLYNKAVSDQNGMAYMRTHQPDKVRTPMEGSSTIVQKDEQHDVQVGTIRLDDCIPWNIDIGILQLDVEEHEDEALLGAQQTITRQLPLILVETMPTKAKSLLDALGYKNTATVHFNHLFCIPDVHKLL
jgi:FkbM family methyltransferase